MSIDRMYYPVKTLGFGNRFGIWTIGCPRRCPKCSNPELQDTLLNKTIDIDTVLSLISQYKSVIDGVTITGGDPFFQPVQLRELLIGIRKLQINDVLVYTGYTMEEILSLPATADLLQYIGVLIDGPYRDDLNDNKSIRGSSNQKIYVLDKTLQKRYQDIEAWTRKTQIAISGNQLFAIGIPLYYAG